MAARPTTHTPSMRGRRSARASGDDRERAILATAERLLAERSLHEISIDDLARGAGISRPTFYFYFPSKDAVLLTLLDRMIEEARAVQGDAVERLAEDPPTQCRAALNAFFETFGSHRAVTLAAAEARATSSEVRELWADVMAGWVSEAAAAIESERERGAAPAGVPARDLAIALIAMNERVLQATFAADASAIPEDDVVDVLLAVWLNAIYGTASFG